MARGWRQPTCLSSTNEREPIVLFWLVDLLICFDAHWPKSMVECMNLNVLLAMLMNCVRWPRSVNALVLYLLIPDHLFFIFILFCFNLKNSYLLYFNFKNYEKKYQKHFKSFLILWIFFQIFILPFDIFNIFSYFRWVLIGLKMFISIIKFRKNWKWSYDAPWPIVIFGLNLFDV